MERLRSAEHGGQGLVGNAYDVVQRLLRRQRDSRRLAVEAHHPRTCLAGLVALAHVPRPDPPGGAQLGDLLKKVVVDVPEEGQARREAVDIETAGDPALDICKAVGERERELLSRRGARLADVIARDRNRVPERRVLCAPFEHVDDDFEGRLDWIDPGVLGHVFLEDVVLHGAAQLRDRNALFLRGGDIEAEQNCRRPVDRHGRRDLVERDAVEQGFHVRQGRNGDTAFPDFPLGPGMVGVVAHQCRKVERDGETRLPMLEQELVALVGIGRAAEAGELPHRPELAAVHRGMNPARERIFTGATQLPFRIEAVQIGGRVHRLFPDGHLPFLTLSRTSAATS